MEAGDGGSEEAACDDWQSGYKDDKARVIFDNIARGGGHALWLERFRLDIWEDRSIGRVLQPRDVGDLHPWRVARLSYKATAALRWYRCQSCSRREAGPTKGPSPGHFCGVPPCRPSRPASGSHSVGRSGRTRPALPLAAVGELGYPMPLLPPGPDTSLSLSWQLSEGKMMERRKKIALELSELVVYCRPVPFDEESEHLLVWWPPQAVTMALQTPQCAPRCCFG